MCCSNHIVGCQSDDNASGRLQNVLKVDGPVGREHAVAVWREEEGISLSVAGDYPLVQRPKHLCLGIQLKKVRIGSILADDPSDFWDCSVIMPMGDDELIEEFPDLSSTNADHFDVFPVTNRGIQIWMPLRRYRDSDRVFKAYLSCRSHGHSKKLMSIDLVLWNSNYYRYPSTGAALEDSLAEFHQVYLRYEDISDHTVTFDIDDSAIIENGFTCSHVYPMNLVENTFTLTTTNPFCIKTYSNKEDDGCFEVHFGQCFGLDWVHLDVAGPPDPWIHDTLPKVQMPGEALSIADAPSQVDSLGRLWIYHFQPPGSTWIVRVYRVAWERSKVRLRIEVFQTSHFQNGLNKWTTCDVEVSDFLVHVDCYHGHS